jgi:deoxyadenosine/deoxycytidine kinase
MSIGDEAKLVFISGNSGVGKSTLTQALSGCLSWDGYVEQAEVNPFLADYFLEVQRWAFHVQLYYLARHLRDCNSIHSQGRSAIRDRSFYEGAEVYVPHLVAEGVLSKREWDLYSALYENASATFLKPDLLIYVRGTVELLLDRIGTRGRPNERIALATHIGKLNERYESWIAGFRLCPVLCLEADQIDFRRSEDIRSVAEVVRACFRTSSDSSL